ncbi:MAG: hypothetical protein KGJ55_00490 [Gammaproteobacteria bacterium]|nr:hypothetical protein [Gammaproteobacteria bacterium]
MSLDCVFRAAAEIVARLIDRRVVRSAVGTVTVAARDPEMTVRAQGAACSFERTL